MKRPLFDIGCSCLVASAVVLYAGAAAGYLLLAVSVTLAFVLSLGSHRVRWRQACICLLSCGAAVVFTLSAVERTERRYERFDNTDAVIRAVVTDRVNAHLFEVYGTVTADGGETASARMTVYTQPAEGLTPGEEFTGRVSLKVNHPFSAEDRYSIGEARPLFGYLAGEAERSDRSNYPLRAALARYRYGLHRQLLSELGQDIGSLVGAVTLGINTLGDGIQQQARDAGIYHVLAISGLHLSIFLQIILFLFPFARIGRRAGQLMALGIIWLPVLLAGTGFSVLRAVLMHSVLYFGNLIRRKGDGLNTLGFAALAIWLWNPFAVLSLSFVLSMLATLGILLYRSGLAGYLDRFRLLDLFGPLREPAVQMLACGLSAQLAVAPVLYLMEQRVVLNGLLSGLFLIPLMTPLLLLGYLLCGLLSASVVLITWAAWPLRLVGGAFLDLMAWSSKLPFSVYLTSRAVMLLILAGYAVLFWLTAIKCSQYTARTAAVLGAVLLSGTLLLEHAALAGTVRIVTAGEDLAMIYGQQAVVLLAGREGESIRQELRRYQVRQVDFLLIDSFTPLEGVEAAELIREFPVQHLFAPDVGSARSYLSAVYDGEVFYGQNAEIAWYDGIRLDYQSEKSLEIAAGDILLLKFLSIYDIIENNVPGDAVLLPAGGGVEWPGDQPGLQVRQSSRRRSELLLDL